MSGEDRLKLMRSIIRLSNKMINYKTSQIQMAHSFPSIEESENNDLIESFVNRQSLNGLFYSKALQVTKSEVGSQLGNFPIIKMIVDHQNEFVFSSADIQSRLSDFTQHNVYQTVSFQNDQFHWDYVICIILVRNFRFIGLFI